MPRRSSSLPIAAIAAFAVAALSALLPAFASAGPPKLLKVHSAGVSGPVLGAADARTLAVRTADGAVTLIDDGGPRRAVPPRAGCVASAAGSSLIAWDCDDVAAATPQQGPAVGDAILSVQHVRTVVITDLAGAEQGRVAIPYAYDLEPASGVGATWVVHGIPPLSGKGVPHPMATNWHTGEQRLIAEDATGHADLDRVDLVAPYCSEVRAEPIYVSNGYAGPRLRPVQYRAPWALVDSRTGPLDPSNPIRHVLRRCGLARAVTAPASLTTAAEALLGDGWVAWRPRLRNRLVDPGPRRPLHLLRLGDRRRFVVEVTGSITLTAGAAWISTGRSHVVRRVGLPG